MSTELDPKHSAGPPRERREVTAERCVCGARWIKTYLGDYLLHMRCGRGHDPGDFLSKAFVNDAYVEESRFHLAGRAKS